MRIKTNQTKNQGSVLLVTLCTAWVIGIALVSYLTLVANQSRTTFHSQSWSGCIPVLEAGIEEALTQLNYDNAEGLNNAEAHGWTLMTNGSYFKSEIVGPSTDGSYYEVTLDPNTNGTPATPIIISKGYVPAPGNTGKPMGGDTAFGMILGTVSGQSTPALISRTVKVGTQLQKSGGGAGGINTKGTINLSGGSLDSFDSSDPLKSTNGQYDLAKRQANGKAMSNSSVAGAIDVGNGWIYGTVTTGPGAGTVAIGNGAVGDATWNSTGVTGLSGLARVQTGHSGGDSNIQFDDVEVPFVYGSGSAPQTSVTVGGTNYSWVLNAAVNNKFQLGSVNVGAGKSMIVTGGEVTLYVSGDFANSGSGFIYVAPGAKLNLYITGKLAVSGSGILNGDNYASNVHIYGLGTTKQIWAYSGGSDFTGIVYAPYNQFTFSGDADAHGSFSANNVVISGGARIHYDESLSGASDPQYLACSWNEI